MPNTVKRRRRTKVAYQELFDNPGALFDGCKVLIYPNGEPEIWIHSTNGRQGIRIVASFGPVGLGIRINTFVFGSKLRAFASFPDSEETIMLEDSEIELCQPDGTEYADVYHSWYRGEIEHPGTREEWEARQSEQSDDDDDGAQDEATPEDYTIRCDGFRYHVGIVEGDFLGTFGEIADAENAIRDRMNKDQFWPNVWFVSDHGNVSLHEWSTDICPRCGYRCDGIACGSGE